MVKLESDSDGWIRGSSESIYATKPAASQSTPPPARTPKKSVPATPSRDSQANQTQSLLERMDTTPPPKPQPDASQSQSSRSSHKTPSSASRKAGNKASNSLPLTSPARNAFQESPSHTRTPLSASHPIPETPLKLSQRGGPQTPATPHYPAYTNTSRGRADDDDSPTPAASGLGLGLTPMKHTVPLTPASENGHGHLSEPLSFRRGGGSQTSPTGRSSGSPLKPGRTDIHQNLSLDVSDSTKAATQSDGSRSNKASAGIGASMWAPKPPASSGTTADSADAAPTRHTIGSGFESSKLLGVQMGTDRKRPTHRNSGLQLSLGQEISIMQNVDEGAEEDLPGSNKSSAAVGGAFKIDPPTESNEEQGGWYGNVVPPTPNLGFDSPGSSEDGKMKSSGNANGKWGSQPSLFSNIASSGSRNDHGWSGDDDDEFRDDASVFQEMQRAAKAYSKGRTTLGSSSFGPLPPPTLHYKSRTPSPTHALLAVSPHLDTDRDRRSVRPASPSGSASGMAMQDAVSPRDPDARLSPASALSRAQSDDSDGDADVENEKPKRAKDRKANKKANAEAKKESQAITREACDEVDSLPSMERKKSLKRDKSERIRGRRQSQSKDKDVDSAALAQNIEKSPSLSDTVAKLSIDKANEDAKGPRKDASTVDEVPSTSTFETVQASPPTQTQVEEDAAAVTASSDPATIKPPTTPASTFDWADEDGMEDELPDLDDWGVTLSPTIPAAASGPLVNKNGKGGKKKQSESVGGGAWKAVGQSRQSAKKEPPTKASADAGGNLKGSSGVKKADAGGALGARISGRAGAVVAPSSSAPDRSLPPPASTPYGSWNKTPAAVPASAATKSHDGATFKGSGQRKAPSTEPSTVGKTTSAWASIGKPVSTGPASTVKSPKIPDASTASAKNKKGAPAKVARLPSADNSKTEKAAKNGSQSAADSIHAPSVADSMHAPKGPSNPKGDIKRNGAKKGGSKATPRS